MKTITVTIVLVCVLCLPSTAAQVMAWVPPYAIDASFTGFTADFGGVSPSDVLTHVGMQFWVPSTEGQIKYDPNYPAITDEAIGNFREVCTEKGIKLLLTIWNSPDNVTWDWPWAMACYKDNRAAFVNALYDECVRLNLDGVDMDFEGGTNDIGQENMQGEREAYAEFAKEMGTKLHENGMIFTICSFHSPCFNAPNMSWWPDWAGYVDYVHIMGYQDNFEASDMTIGNCTDALSESGNTDMFSFSYKVNWALSCGLGADVPSIGLGTWLDQWGGKDVRGNIQDILSLEQVPGVCMWDLQLQADPWRQAETWNLLKEIKEIEHPIKAAKPAPANMLSEKIKASSSKSGLKVSVAEKGVYDIDVFNASGRNIAKQSDLYLKAGNHFLPINRNVKACGVTFVKIKGASGAVLKKEISVTE
jgi:hypothetical protein